MATSSIMVKTIIIYFSISILLYAGGVRFTDAIGGTAFNKFVNTSNTSASILDNNNQYSTGGILGVAPNVKDQSTTVATGFGIIDALRAVRDFVELIVNILAAIPTLFFYFPPVVQLFVGVPLGLLALIGVIYFARSGT